MIEVDGVTKVYPGHAHAHRVLDGVSFTVPPGLKLGLLGRNGSGKSTLIRLIAKVEVPTRGAVRHRMSVSWPLGFGGTFQGSLTGIDNIKFIARIYEQDYARLRAFVDDFAELGDFLYEPVKTYSSGMRARLAFALSIAIEFDCYLIDEVIMVGDQRCQARCREHLFDRKAGRALVVASHDRDFIKATCDAAIVMDQGKARWFGNVDEALATYSAM
jgi:capsular polysaccharide transport system ATP-binding protein